MVQYSELLPRLVGTTAETNPSTVLHGLARASSDQENEGQAYNAEILPHRNRSNYPSTSNYFKSAQWHVAHSCTSSHNVDAQLRSPDGTTILSSSYDNKLRSFVLPPDLLSPEREPPHILTPYSFQQSPEPVYATKFHPAYNLQELSTCLVLASIRSLPLRLFSPFAPGILTSYPLVSPTTETYITPYSLLFSHANMNHFFAGSDSRLSIFDLNRDGEGPISTRHTTPSRRHHTAAAGGMKGIVSTLAMSSDGILAAGTFSRWVGLYDGYGRGDTVSAFAVAQQREGDESTDGKGLTQVMWSQCGRYLCTVERGSDGIGVLDIRGNGKWLAWLKGRNARTPQRLGVDMIGGEVWAGGIDGLVRVWEGLGMTEGVINPKWEYQAHSDVVSSTIMHQSGSVLATCSGQRHDNPSLELASQESGSHIESSGSSSPNPRSSQFLLGPGLPGAVFDNSLKIWAL